MATPLSLTLSPLLYSSACGCVCVWSELLTFIN